jgi:hypothetical protein
MGVVYEEKSNFSKDLSFYLQATIIYRQSLPLYSHPNVIEIENFI